jgi:uncharacterized protein (DUF362 family)
MSAKVFLANLQNNYGEQIRLGLDFIQAGSIIKPDTKVFIKPNLTFPSYMPGVMTHPEAVEAAILALLDYTPHVYIGDSDSGGYNRFSMDRVYVETGIAEFASKYGVQVVNLSTGASKPIQFKYKNKSFSLNLPTILLEETDLLVTMPVPKVHANSGVSLTFKNQWGCIPQNEDRLRLHPYLQHVILEVCQAVKAKIGIIDGQYGLNVNGPLRGEPVKLDWLMVADDLGAGARMACELMQIPLESIPHLRYAKSRGWVPDREEITTNCDISPFIKEKFYLKRKLTDLPGLLAYRSPFIAYLGYFSPIANLLHKLLYIVREPFYDYDKYVIRR